MKIIYLHLILITISLSNSFSQKTKYLYTPKEVQNAYKNDTRTQTGEPGKNYFINKPDYKIKASFNPETREIIGEETITYSNNSTDSLDLLYFNLYMDFFKKGNTRDWDVGKTDITEGVNITKIIVNNNEIDLNKTGNNSSMLVIKPKNKLLPNSTNSITIEWNFIYQGKTTVRGGEYGDKNFFISYWFPKIAVYDDIVWWNNHGHTGSQEFYNDFGNYDVEISLPEKYIAWSTGILQNADKIFKDEYITKINKAKESDEIIHIITTEDYAKNNIFKTKAPNTWKFKSENTPDFAFAISKNYLWDATSVLINNKRISINTAYKENSTDFKQVAEISKNAIKFFSNEIPAIAYPYPQFTAFNGGGGMEFPGMVNNGDNTSLNETLYLTAHEMGHSYFPFYTGLNEQKYAWMDEGLITFFPQLFVEKFTNDTNYVFFKNTLEGYNKSANSFIDVPLMIPSDNISKYAYRFQSYTRSSVAFYELYKLLGKEKFVAGLQLFAQRWNGKHPIPYDFFYTFNEIAGEDLAWFWKPWFFLMGAADLSLGKLETIDNETFINIENYSGFPVSIKLTVKYTNNDEKKYNYSSSVWKTAKTFKIKLLNDKIKEIRLDSETTPDAFSENNTMIFK